jgi:hypothetical protein
MDGVQRFFMGMVAVSAVGFAVSLTMLFFA